MMRVLLVAEGPSELNGALQSLVARVRGEEIDFQCERMSDPKVRVHIAHGKGAGFTKRALGWLRLAMREGADALVLLIDEDGARTRQQELDAAQDNQLFALPRAMGVAIRTFDAWMLADEVALSQVLGRPVERSQAPESIRDPKETFNRLASEDARDASLLYAGVAKVVDLARLQRRCPRGFGGFSDRIKKLSA